MVLCFLTIFLPPVNLSKISTVRRFFLVVLCDKAERNSPLHILIKKLSKTFLRRGGALWRMKGPILHVLWMDKKAVWVAGTATSAPPADFPEVQRRARDGSLQPVTCPSIVSTYNKYMGGVDKNDQMKSYYQIPVSGKKWWTRLLFDLVARAIYNSLVLHNESPNHAKQSPKNFRLELAKDLIVDFSSRWKRGQASLEQSQGRYVDRHFPAYLPLNEKGKRMERRCTFCTDNKAKKTKTAFIVQTVKLACALLRVLKYITSLIK